MLAFILTLGLALIWQLAAGSAFALLWNWAPAAAFGLPPVTWLQGVGIYLVIRAPSITAEAGIDLRQRFVTPKPKSLGGKQP